MVVVDSRPFDEYQRVSIPTSTNVPGAELVLRIHDIAPKPETLVVVNCAGRTRSIIGAQSLINAGNSQQGRRTAQRHDGLQSRRVQTDSGKNRRALTSSAQALERAKAAADRVASRYKIKRISTGHHRMLAQRANPIAPSICSTFAIRRNTPPAMCRARFPRQAASSFRRPTNTPAHSARASC